MDNVNKNNNSNKYKKITQKEHVLLRPGMYVGQTTTEKTMMWAASFKESDNEIKLEKKEVNYNPAILKLFDEIVSNASDAYIKTGKVSYIKIDVDKNGFVVENDIEKGYGIPVEIHPEEKCYIPELIFGHLLTGENYDENSDREGAGMNGLGAKLVSIFSKEFIVEVADGKKYYKQTFKDNLSKIEPPKIRESQKSFVKISSKIDFSHFQGKNEIDDDMLSLFLKRIIDLSAFNLGLKFIFNGHIIKLKNYKDWIKLHLESEKSDFFVEEYDKWFIGVAKSNSEQFEHVSIASSVSTYRGGTHVNSISLELSKAIADNFPKKYKCNWADVKNKLFLFIIAKIPNPSFDSQTKEYLTTPMNKSIIGDVVFTENFIKKIIKSEIVQSIIDSLLAKEQMELAKLQKAKSKLKVEKLIDANSKNRKNCILYIFEGDSAGNASRKFRDPMIHGIFKLRGKILNVKELDYKKIMENKELVNLMNTIGLTLGKKVNKEELRYSKIIIQADKDMDGDSITALLINFFNLWPELFEWDMIYRGLPPLLVATKGTEKYVFYTEEEYFKWKNKNNIDGFRVSYKKGVGSLNDEDYKNMLLDPFLIKIKKDSYSDEKLNIWFGKDSELRKEELMK